MDVSDGADNTFACAQANVTASEKLEVSSDDDTDDCVTDKDAAPPCIECPVCLQPCIHPVQLPCSHIFCFLCVKGVANRSKRCALCRQEIPLSYFHNPKLVRQEDLLHQAAFEDGYQWFYEGRNGWWQYDERTSTELEERYKREEKTFELLIAGFLYVIDLDSMLQYRRNDPTRRRRIKRDLENIPEKKGVAGLRVKTTAPLSRQGAYGVETTDSAGKGQPTPASNGQGDQNDTSQGLVVSPGSVPTPTNSPHNPQTHTGPRTSNRGLSSVMRNLNISHAGDGSLSPEPRRGPNGTPANSTGAVRPDGRPSRSDGQPSGPDEQSSGTNGQPSGPDGRPSRYDGQPSGPDGRPSRSNGQPSGPYGRPSRSNGHPSGPDGRPSRSDGQQPGPDGRPSRSNGQLSVPDGRPSRANVSLSGPDGRPSRSDGQPSGPDGHPSRSDGQPSGPDGRPSRTNGQLSGTDGRPSRTDGLPDEQRPDGQSNGSDSQLSTPDGDISISDGQPSRLNGRNSRSDGQSSWPERQVGIPEGPDGHHNPRLDAHRSRIDGQLSSLSGQPQVARQTSPHLQQQRDRESPHVQAPPLTSVTDEDALPLPARLHHQSSPQESRPAQRSAPSPRRQSKPPGQANEGGGENPCGTALPQARRSQSSPRVRHLSPTSHEAGSSVSDSGVSQRHSDPSPREARPALRHTRGQRNR